MGISHGQRRVMKYISARGFMVNDMSMNRVIGVEQANACDQHICNAEGHCHKLIDGKSATEA